MKKKNILIIYEFNKLSGLGHLTRAEILSKKLSKIFSIKLVNIYNLNLQNKSHIDLVILDFKKYSKDKIKNVKKINPSKILTLDNFENSFGDLNVSVFEHNKKLNRSKRLYGLEYSLIRPEIEKKIIKNQDIIFISLGFLINKSKINLIKKIYKKRGKNILALSPNFKNKIKTNKNMIVLNKKNYFRYFKLSKLCVTNAGNTLIEALYLNKKCIVEPQTKNEIKFAKYLKKENMIFDVNILKNKNIEDLTKLKTHNCIDGRGIIRVINIIKKLVYDKNI